MRTWGKEPLLLDNDLCIMVLQRCPTAAWPHPVKREREPLAISHIAWTTRLPSTRQGFLPISILDCSFTFLCLALSIPCFCTFKETTAPKPLLLGTSQACTVQVPVRVHVGCGVLSTFAGFTVAQFIGKRKRDADLTLSQVSFIYILTWVRARMLVIGNVQYVTFKRWAASSYILRPDLRKELNIIHYHDEGSITPRTPSVPKC